MQAAAGQRGGRGRGGRGRGGRGRGRGRGAARRAREIAEEEEAELLDEINPHRTGAADARFAPNTFRLWDNLRGALGGTAANPDLCGERLSEWRTERLLPDERHCVERQLNQCTSGKRLKELRDYLIQVHRDGGEQLIDVTLTGDDVIEVLRKETQFFRSRQGKDTQFLNSHEADMDDLSRLEPFELQERVEQDELADRLVQAEARVAANVTGYVTTIGAVIDIADANAFQLTNDDKFDRFYERYDGRWKPRVAVPQGDPPHVLTAEEVLDGVESQPMPLDQVTPIELAVAEADEDGAAVDPEDRRLADHMTVLRRQFLRERIEQEINLTGAQTQPGARRAALRRVAEQDYRQRPSETHLKTLLLTHDRLLLKMLFDLMFHGSYAPAVGEQAAQETASFVRRQFAELKQPEWRSLVKDMIMTDIIPPPLVTDANVRVLPPRDEPETATLLMWPDRLAMEVDWELIGQVAEEPNAGVGDLPAGQPRLYLANDWLDASERQQRRELWRRLIGNTLDTDAPQRAAMEGLFEDRDEADEFRRGFRVAGASDERLQRLDAELERRGLERLEFDRAEKYDRWDSFVDLVENAQLFAQEDRDDPLNDGDGERRNVEGEEENADVLPSDASFYALPFAEEERRRFESGSMLTFRVQRNPQYDAQSQPGEYGNALQLRLLPNRYRAGERQASDDLLPIWWKTTIKKRKHKNSNKAMTIMKRWAGALAWRLELDVVVENPPANLDAPWNRPDWMTLMFKALCTALYRDPQAHKRQHEHDYMSLTVPLDRLKLFGNVNEEAVIYLLRRYLNFALCVPASQRAEWPDDAIDLLIEDDEPDGYRRVYATVNPQGQSEVWTVAPGDANAPDPTLGPFLFRPMPTQDELWKMLQLYYEPWFELVFGVSYQRGLAEVLFAERDLVTASMKSAGFYGRLLELGDAVEVLPDGGGRAPDDDQGDDPARDQGDDPVRDQGEDAAAHRNELDEGCGDADHGDSQADVENEKGESEEGEEDEENEDDDDADDENNNDDEDGVDGPGPRAAPVAEPGGARSYGIRRVVAGTEPPPTSAPVRYAPYRAPRGGAEVRLEQQRALRERLNLPPLQPRVARESGSAKVWMLGSRGRLVRGLPVAADFSSTSDLLRELTTSPEQAEPDVFGSSGFESPLASSSTTTTTTTTTVFTVDDEPPPPTSTAPILIESAEGPAAEEAASSYATNVEYEPLSPDIESAFREIRSAYDKPSSPLYADPNLVWSPETAPYSSTFEFVSPSSPPRTDVDQADEPTDTDSVDGYPSWSGRAEDVSPSLFFPSPEQGAAASPEPPPGSLYAPETEQELQMLAAVEELLSAPSPTVQSSAGGLETQAVAEFSVAVTDIAVPVSDAEFAEMMGESLGAPVLETVAESPSIADIAGIAQEPETPAEMGGGFEEEEAVEVLQPESARPRTTGRARLMVEQPEIAGRERLLAEQPVFARPRTPGRARLLAEQRRMRRPSPLEEERIQRQQAERDRAAVEALADYIASWQNWLKENPQELGRVVRRYIPPDSRLTADTLLRRAQRLVPAILEARVAEGLLVPSELVAQVPPEEFAALEAELF
ncbi:Hypothetical protein UVM_LOCUS393 [uncultured virus]|nr:Hypothetical protein UVM_LOCUS393 [uncultured virus]